ncbi:MAG: beta-glucosidase, partial [Spirochaetales bacterium]|nr:beta-glucosidase [Spirochaetales bacterium]
RVQSPPKDGTAVQERTDARDFYWGAATASYQIEGSPLADGAGASIWHDFAHRRGKIRNGDTGDTACDHYRRYRSDVREMQRLGLQAYRFSVAWPRIVPEPGTVNPRGLDFYSRLVDELLERGITPFCTLFHWDAPAWLERRGGFARRDSLEALCHYGRVLFEALGDRVKHWITINEPVVYAAYGYFFGLYAPGQRLRLRRMLAVSHHLLLGHARLVRILRQTVPDAAVGIAQHQVAGSPRDPGNPRDVRAAEFADQMINRFYLDPLYFGKYPPEILRRLRLFLPRDYERDLPEMREPGDFLALNYYQAQSYRHCPWVPIARARVVPTPGAQRNDLGWEVDPGGLYRMLCRLKEEYGNPTVYVTENGYPTVEEPERQCSPPHAGLDDRQRIAYLDAHIRAVASARREGSRTAGYFVWSLMDNFEWAEGYRARFGLLHVNFATQERTWRASARWYRERIQTGGPETGGPEAGASEAGTADGREAV